MTDLDRLLQAIIVRAACQAVDDYRYDKPFGPQYEEHLDRIMHLATADGAFYGYGQLRRALQEAEALFAQRGNTDV